MALNAKEWLLKGIGDSRDVRRDLDETAARLDQVDGTTAEVDVQLETTRLKEELQAAKAELKALGSETVDVDADLNTAAMKIHIREIEAQLAILDQKDVSVDVNVDRDGAARGGLMGLIDLGRKAWDALGNLLSDGARSASSSVTGMGSSAGSAGGEVGALASVAGEAAAVVGVIMVAAVGAGITALVALAASAGAAALALGALAIAAAALVIPFAVTAVGAIAVFKEEADKAGTAANALKTRASGIASVFKSALRPAADAVFRGLTAALKGVPQLLRSLQPAFTTLGKAIGSAFKTLGQEFTSPAWQAFFKLLAGAAARVVPLLTGSFIQFARILRNIATAAMPFLIQGLKAINRWLKGLAGGTSNAESLRKGISGLVGHLVEWVKLGAELGKGFFGLLKAAAPIGLAIVKWLSEGAQKIQEWVNSAEGQQRIKQFFEDVLPLIKQVATFFGQLAIVAIELFQALAPSIAFVFQGLNLLLKPVIFLLDLFNQIPASVRSWLIPFAGVFSTINSTIGVLKLLLGLFAPIGAALARLLNTAPGAAWRWISDKAKAAFDVVKSIAGGAAGAVSAVLSVGRKAWDWITAAARNVAGAVRGVAGGLARAVGDIVGRMVGRPWHWLSDAAKTVAGAVRGVVSALVGFVKARVNDAISVIRSIADALRTAKDKVASAARDIVSAIKEPINALIDGINSIKLHLSIHKGLPGPLPDINVDTDIDPFPTVPHLARGIRNFAGGLAWVGETGPELAAFPSGTDVFTSGDSRRMARGGVNIEQINITPAEGDWIDETDAAAQLNHRLRTIGAWD